LAFIFCDLVLRIARFKCREQLRDAFVLQALCQPVWRAWRWGGIGVKWVKFAESRHHIVSRVELVASSDGRGLAEASRKKTKCRKGKILSFHSEILRLVLIVEPLKLFLF